ncbi:MAG: phosphodiester glycosidase family protein [Desulfovibrionales bacterium]|nr:phosphodiester glycosidase family protein [Desulfovibrionales bacterium]
MTRIRHYILFFLTLLILLFSLQSQARAAVNWIPVADGLALSEIPVDTGSISTTTITVLRISPQKYEFVLLMRSKEGDAFTPSQWAARYTLTALIYASMYLPDNSKSTGFMRDNEHINNGFIHNSFGSFFVANPRSSDFPAVDIIDRHQTEHDQLLPNYGIVIQNYRLFSTSRKPLWPEKAKESSIAAVGKDAKGNIVFIHCRTPMTVRKFTKALLDSALELEAAMYVEGGPEASMYLTTPQISRTWAGRYIGDFWNTEEKQWILPNVLGIRPITTP